MRPIPIGPVTPTAPPSAAFTELRADDHVRVTLRSESVVAFQVADVQTDALVAKDRRRFLYSDMTRLEKRHVSAAKTIGLSMAIFAGCFILAGVITVGW